MTGRPREFDRDEALDKAMELFWSQGYGATGVAELCDRMGIGRQSLYNTFGDKETLFSEALGRYRISRLKPLVDILREPGSGITNVRRVFDAWEGHSASASNKGCLMANSIAEFGMREPALSAELGRMLGEIEDGFAFALEKAAKDGELPEGRDPRTLARLLTTLGQGLATVGKLDPTGSFARDTLSSAHALLE